MLNNYAHMFAERFIVVLPIVFYHDLLLVHSYGNSQKICLDIHSDLSNAAFENLKKEEDEM